MTTHDTWILVSVPSGRGSRGIAARLGLALLGMSAPRPDRTRRSVALDRVARPLPVQRPFC